VIEPINSKRSMLARQNLIWQRAGLPRCPRFLMTPEGLVPESVGDYEIFERMKALIRLGQLDPERRLPFTLIDPQDGSVISDDQSSEHRMVTFYQGEGWTSEAAPSDDA
jgi:hypothetical protein